MITQIKLLKDIFVDRKVFFESNLQTNSYKERFSSNFL